MQRLCDVLEVSRSGFYAGGRRATPSARMQEEEGLRARVRALAARTRYSYGSRRIAKQLQAEGVPIGRTKVRRLMRQAGIVVRRPRRRGPSTTDSHHREPVAPNRLARHFEAAAPNQVWAGDTTYIWTQEGWLYVAMLLDLYARKVVGWAMSPRHDTALVYEALRMALGRRQPAAGLLHHSDRGSQYASAAYQRLLAAQGIVCSMSRTGECLDNAVAERWWGSLKGEWTGHRQYATRQEAQDDIVVYIEMFYNSHRRHSALGYRSPNEYEQRPSGA